MSRTRPSRMALRYGAFCVALTLAGCTSEPAPSPTNTRTPTPTATPTIAIGTLTEEPRTANFAISVTSGEIRYDGLAVVAASGQPLKIRSITPAPTDSDAVEVIRTGVVELADADPSAGLLNTFPPAFAPRLAITDTASAQLQPERRYALMLVVRAKKTGLWSPPTLTVTYLAGNELHMIEVNHPVKICVNAEKTAEC